MEVIYIILLAIVGLAMSVRALTCYGPNGVIEAPKTCDSDTTYCYLVSTTIDLQDVVYSECQPSSQNYECESLQCQYSTNVGGYLYCCTTDNCNTSTGKTCVTTTTSTTTSTTTTETPSASSKLGPSFFLILCLTMLSLLMTNALF